MKKRRRLTILVAVLVLSAVSAVYAASIFLELWRVPSKVTIGHEYLEVTSVEGVSLSSLDFGNLYEAGQTVTLEFIVGNKGKADIDVLWNTTLDDPCLNLTLYYYRPSTGEWEQWKPNTLKYIPASGAVTSYKIRAVLKLLEYQEATIKFSIDFYAYQHLEASTSSTG